MWGDPNWAFSRVPGFQNQNGGFDYESMGIWENSGMMGRIHGYKTMDQELVGSYLICLPFLLRNRPKNIKNDRREGPQQTIDRHVTQEFCSNFSQQYTPLFIASEIINLKLEAFRAGFHRGEGSPSFTEIEISGSEM